MEVVITVGEVETSHIHPGIDESAYPLLAGDRGPEGGDDLRLALHISLTLPGQGPGPLDPGGGFPGYEESFCRKSSLTSLGSALP